MIRDSVEMDRILDLYGYKVKHGFMCCPFHGEKTPSLKVYPKTGGWHCFGCGRGGSVIDFVMEHEGVSFPVAVRAIDQTLGLGLMNPKEDPEDARRERRLQKALDDFISAVLAYCDALERQIEGEQLRNWRKMKRLEGIQYGSAEQLTADDYTFLLTWKESDLYNEYRKEKIREFREVAEQWRRKARRAT